MVMLSIRSSTEFYCFYPFDVSSNRSGNVGSHISQVKQVKHRFVARWSAHLRFGALSDMKRQLFEGVACATWDLGHGQLLWTWSNVDSTCELFRIPLAAAFGFSILTKFHSHHCSVSGKLYEWTGWDVAWAMWSWPWTKSVSAECSSVLLTLLRFLRPRSKRSRRQSTARN